jgi:hypothetical protein
MKFRLDESQLSVVVSDFVISLLFPSQRMEAENSIETTATLRHIPENKTVNIRRRWVDNIKMDLREIRLSGMDWIDLAQDRDQWCALVNTVMNLRVP